MPRGNVKLNAIVYMNLEGSICVTDTSECVYKNSSTKMFRIK